MIRIYVRISRMVVSHRPAAGAARRTGTRSAEHRGPCWAAAIGPAFPPVHRGHLPPSGASGNRTDPVRSMDSGGLVASPARVVGGAGPAAAHRLDAAKGAA